VARVQTYPVTKIKHPQAKLGGPQSDTTTNTTQTTNHLPQEHQNGTGGKAVPPKAPRGTLKIIRDTHKTTSTGEFLFFLPHSRSIHAHVAENPYPPKKKFGVDFLFFPNTFRRDIKRPAERDNICGKIKWSL
jgi:hypothetical protein